MPKLIIVFFVLISMNLAQTPPAKVEKPTFDSALASYWQADSAFKELRAQFAELHYQLKLLQEQATPRQDAVKAARAELEQVCTSQGKVLTGLDAAPFKASCETTQKPEKK